MATRTQILTDTLLNLDLTPRVGVQVRVFLQTPGGLPVTDLEGGVLLNGQQFGETVVTNSSGLWSAVAVYPGDLRDGNGAALTTSCQLVVVEGGVQTLSPLSFAYAASITVSTWYPLAVSAAGMIPMLIDLRLVSNAADQGATIQFGITATAVAPNATTLDAAQFVPISTDAGGNAVIPNWPSAGLNPPTTTYVISFPDGTLWYYLAPALPIGYQGAYNGATAYHKNAGTKASPADVVLSGGVYYQAIADSTGSAPPSVNWQVWPGEPIVWHLTQITTPGGVVISTTGVAASADLAPVAGDPVAVSLTLDDNLINLAHRITVAGGAATTAGLSPVATPRLPGTTRPDGLTLDLAADGTVSVHGASVTPITPALSSFVSGVASGNFCAYPDLVVTPTKRIVLAFLDGFGDGVAGGRACVIHSDDDGATWSARAYPFGSSPSGYWNAAGGIVCTASGRLVLAVTQAQVSIQPTGNTVWYVTSDDNGGTWSAPVQFPGGFTAWNYASNAGMVHSGGTILLPVYGQDTGDPTDNNHNRAGVMRSVDGGHTWTFARISSTNNNLNETSPVELPDGSLRSYSRQDTGTSSMNLYTSASTDAGATWSVPTALTAFTAWPGHPGALRVAGSQTILLWLRSTTAEHSVWRYSEDLGVTWSAEQLYSNTVYAYGAFTDYDTNSVVGAVGLQATGSSAQIDFVRFAAGQTMSLAGTGSVTSVGLTVPADETVTGSPITAAGTLAITRNNQAQNTVLAGPTTGTPATPAYRTLVPGDLPIATAAALGGVKPDGTTITVTSGGVITAAASGSTLASLGDVNEASPHDGDLLVYRASDSKWHNTSPTGPGSIRWETVSDASGNPLFDANGAYLTAPVAN